MYKERLKEYIELDVMYQDYKKGETDIINDFGMFCIEHCQDIQDLLNEVEELHNKIDKAIEYIEWQRDNPQYDNVWRKYECNSLIEILKG